MFKYFLYRFAQLIFLFLPIGASYGIARFISTVVYIFSFRDRRAVKKNLKIICGNNGDINKYTKEVFLNFGLYLVEFLYMKRNVDKEYIDKNVKLENVEALDRVLADRTGGILLTSHIGNWELGGVILSILGYPIVAIALPHKERPVNDLFNHQRQARGIRVVQMNHAIRRCSEALKSNQLVALLADRDFSKSGEPMKFLGKLTSLPKGAAMFAVKSDVPIIPTFMIRKNRYQFVLQVGDPVYPKDYIVSDDEQENVKHLINVCAKIMEEKIRQYPAQWLMFRQFWL